jgi:hypothetical protein
MHWPWREEDIGSVERRKTSQFPMQLFFPRMGDIAPCRIRLCFMTLLVWGLHSSIFLVQWLERMLRKEKELSQIPVTRTTSPIEVRTSKVNRSSTRSNMTLLDNRIGQIHEGTSEIMTTWFKSEPTPCRVLARNQWYTSSTRANGRRLWNCHDMARW